MKNIVIKIIKEVIKAFPISYKEYLEIIEMLSFGVVINGIYGITSSFNFKDLFVIMIASIFAM